MTTITLTNAGNMKKKKHTVLKRIKYKSHQPGTRYAEHGEVLTFAHLSDVDYLTGIKCKLYALVKENK
ncbi:MAG: hypothetical protein GY938_12755 [Ketobacter sp.]|nr:hypothetical protein [Ketobacter sp.]